ncbi:MAG: methyltransferase domain-containing protein [Phaeodactylibacter sp.]|nr:methyltransferase domain-containing protein [Phaeodactylibacter sp.]MCB9292054.1 methyltransferase domain-containing protein [Lewinellaceae bacterium]
MPKSITTPQPPVKDKKVLPASLRYIVEKLEERKEWKPAEVRRIVLEAGVRQEDLEPWADYGHPATDSYGRRLIYAEGNFEMMAMSWAPGDFSAIHDHGYTQWGAVQVFGPAEHAAFRVDEGRISTLSRTQFNPGDVVGVSHTLVHQMGNPTDGYFMTLHVYGRPEDIDNVTGDARVYDLERETIQRVDGGVFYALPEEEVKWTEPGPRPDFPTRLRHMVELARRLRRMQEAGIPGSRKRLEAVLADLFSDQHRAQLLRCLDANVDENGHQSNSVYWRNLNHELKEAAQLQRELQGNQNTGDNFHHYAELYDALVCQPCLDSFMRGYLEFFREKYRISFPDSSLLSVGCGTGLVERTLIDEFGIPYQQLFGMDISPAMVSEASRRIRAEVGDILAFDADGKTWDIAFSGLNVYHYLDFKRLEDAIQRTAERVSPGGYFIGDFITPDHIRWYPNLMYSADKQLVSLRTPRLVENNGRMFQESEIININFGGGEMELNYAGKHLRFLPPLHRIRTYFERAFGGQIDLYDAHSLELIPDWADSCPSTRFVVVARKLVN